MRVTLYTLFFLLFGCGSSTVYLNSELYSESSNSEITIIRPKNKVGSAVSTSIYLNDEIIGKLKIKSYFKFRTDSGEYTLRAGDGTEKTLYFPQSITLKVSENEKICVRLDDDFIDDDRGKHISQKLTLIESKKCKEEFKLFTEAKSSK